MNTIIARIASLRDKRCWTNYKLSKESGIGSGTILNWFKRNATPKLEAIQAVCEAFGITMCEFFNFEQEQVSLHDCQKAILSEFDLLCKKEKESLIEFVHTMNETRKPDIKVVKNSN